MARLVFSLTAHRMLDVRQDKPTTSAQRAAVASLKRGEYLRLSAGADAPVWVRGDYDRTSKTYELQRFDDINRTTFRKGSCLVVVGFTF